MARARPLVLLVIVAAALPGCGGGDDAPPADPEGVIRAWSDALRNGDDERAAAFFQVPAVVQNGTPPIRLTNRAEILSFNLSLPCGARVVRTSQRGPYTDTIFVLTDRPGGACGSGTGSEVATAFIIRDGKIAEWRRLPDPQSDPKVTGPKA